MSSNRLPVLNGTRYIITTHVKERFAERLKLNPNKIDIELYLFNIISGSFENKMILNNTAYMSYVYEKYGSDQRIHFIESTDCIFVCKQHATMSNTSIILTCYDRNFANKNHFNKKPRY